MNIFKLPSKEREKEINNILSNTTSDELLKELIECGLEVTMNDKEKKAIKRCYRRINELKLNFAITNEDLNAIKTVLNLIEKQKAEIEEKDREIIRCGRAANEYKKAVKCKECDCSICEAHINTLELSAEIEKKDKEISKLKNNNKDLLRKLRNRVKEVKKLEKYSTYKKEFSTLNKQLEKKDKIIDLMAKDKYENINMIQMANIGKEVNYDPTKLFSGIPDEEVIKIIKQYFEKKAEEDK